MGGFVWGEAGAGSLCRCFWRVLPLLLRIVIRIAPVTEARVEIDSEVSCSLEVQVGAEMRCSVVWLGSHDGLFFDGGARCFPVGRNSRLSVDLRYSELGWCVLQCRD